MKNGIEKQDFLLKKIQETNFSEFTIFDLWKIAQKFTYDTAIIENGKPKKITHRVFKNCLSLRRAVGSLVSRQKIKIKSVHRTVKIYNV